MEISPTLNRRQAIGWTVVRIGLGVLLLAAAGLKLAGQGVSAVPQVGWFATPMVQIAAAEWEIVLGLWLLSGRFQAGAWLAALGTFVVLAGVSGYLARIGVASCGCLGAVKANPGLAFAVDVTAVLLMLTFRPTSADFGKKSAQLGLAYGGAIAGILIVISCSVAIVFGSINEALARLRGERLTIDQSYIDFGSGVVGQSLEATISVQNWSDQPVQIVGGTSDCSCITTIGLPITIPPRQSQTMPIQLRVKPAQPGTYSRSAQLWTDNDKQPLLHLYMGFRVK